MPTNFVAKLSRHQNVRSLGSYKSASIQHQRRMAFTLSRLSNVRQTSGSSTFLTPFVWIFIRKNQVKVLLQKNEQLKAVRHIPWSYVRELFSHESVQKIVSKSETSHKHQESHFGRTLVLNHLLTSVFM